MHTISICINTRTSNKPAFVLPQPYGYFTTSAPIKLEHHVPLAYFWLSCAFYAAPACTKVWKRTGGTKQVGRWCAVVAVTAARSKQFPTVQICPSTAYAAYLDLRRRNFMESSTPAVDERSLGSFSTGI